MINILQISYVSLSLELIDDVLVKKKIIKFSLNHFLKFVESLGQTW